MTFDDLYFQALGHIGRYQCFLFTLLTLANITSSFFTLVVVFIGGAGQNYTCQGPLEQTDGNFTRNNRSIGNNRSGLSDTADRCHYDEVSLLGNASHTTTRKCESWIYERTGQFDTSLKTQYDLTCEREWLIAFVQTVYMLGWLVGNFVFGSLSDRFGRMTIMPIGYFLQACVGLSLPFVPNYYGALVLKFFLGVVSGGTDLIRFVICLELCGKKWRTVVGIVANNGFNVGIVILAWLAYAFEPMNHVTFQIILGCVPILSISLRWIVPESPRWLASQGRIEEAEKVIRKIARLNGRPIKEDAKIFDADDSNNFCLQDPAEKDADAGQGAKARTYNALDLVRTPNLRRVSFALFVLWFVLAGIYYGFLFLNKDLGANVYINTTISGATGVLAIFVCVPLINFFGRRSTLMVVLAIMTLSLTSAIFLMDNPEYNTALVIIVAIGKFCNILVFDAIYLQTGEIFPTCIRSMGVGMGSLMARVAALLSPLASNLVPIWPKLPIVVFAVLAFIGTLAELLLPETLGRPLPETIEDGEVFSKLSLAGFCRPCSKKKRRMKLLQSNGTCNNVDNEKGC